VPDRTTGTVDGQHCNPQYLSVTWDPAKAAACQADGVPYLVRVRICPVAQHRISKGRTT